MPAASPTASPSSDWDPSVLPDPTLSSDEDADVDVTASQKDRYSMTNLLRSARSKDTVHPASPPPAPAAPRLDSDKSGPAKNTSGPALGSVARRQTRKPQTPAADQASSRLLSPDVVAQPPSRITSSSRSTNTSKTTDSIVSRRTWSIPARPRESRRAAPARDPTPPACPSTPSRPSTVKAPCLVTPDITSASSPQHLPPSPVTRPALEPFRPSTPLALRSPTSSWCRSGRITAAEKGKGRQIDFTPPASPEIDLSRVLVPDSSEKSQNDRTVHLDEDEYHENGGYDDDYPDQCGFDFDPCGEFQEQVEEVDRFDEGEPDRFDEGPPSPGLPPIGPPSRFFDQHLISSQDSSRSRSSTPKRQPPLVQTDSVKRKILLAELGWDDECETRAGPKDDEPPPSSIEIIQGPVPSTSKAKRPLSAPKQRVGHQKDLEGEITIVGRVELAKVFKQSEEDQLRDIGIIVDDLPSSGLAPLMSSWPRAKREAFRAMAGLDKNKSRDQENEDEQGQTEAWEALLAKQQKKASTVKKFPIKKNWLNKPIWKARRKARVGGSARSRFSGKKK